ncbi:hypothetical protein [Schleiferilactobacillus perolens]|jgi:hypothetical protein|uniref:hypothetical protein n=1 Tax=Schleiferilactobacillus perolens TaxID=100468 RepID=UPI0023557FD4|nr:hypothetical protein [Schleiferilactobacillus perolens]MCI2171098.1 hypothetical protein [Schleiferilactobacillus perolens]
MHTILNRRATILSLAVSIPLSFVTVWGTSGRDLVSSLLSSNLPVIVPQMLFLAIWTGEALAYRHVRQLVVLRNKQDVVLEHIVYLYVTMVTLYTILSVTLKVLFLNGTFIDGPAPVGILLLCLRALVLGLIALLLSGVFNNDALAWLVIASVAVNFLYHYVVEYQWLLPLYYGRGR